MPPQSPAAALAHPGVSTADMPTSRYPQLESGVAGRFARLAPTMSERAGRRFAANAALEIGYGGIDTVARGTGVSKGTVRRGIMELREEDGLVLPAGRTRREGAGKR